MTDKSYQYSELHACALRELRMRVRVYPRWVENGKMTEKLADEEISKMQAISEHLAALAQKEQLL